MIRLGHLADDLAITLLFDICNDESNSCFNQNWQLVKA